MTGISRRQEDELDLAVTVMIVGGGWLLLLGPLWWLARVETSQYRIAILTGFAGVFTAFVFLVMGNRPVEAVVATAA